jgi:multiple sugar transport system permease protein
VEQEHTLATRRTGAVAARFDAMLVAAHLLLIAVLVVSVVPFVWMLLGSFKDFNEIVQFPPTLLPRRPTLANYQQIVGRLDFPRAFLNSVVQTVVVTASTLLTSSATAYVFAKYRFWGKEQLFVVLLATMMVPFTVVLVPLYVVVAAWLHLGNTLWGVTVTGLCSTFGIFMMRQFIETVPNELLDAGRIDGASEWWIYRRLILPLASAPLAALGVFTALATWDAFLWPLVVLTSDEVKTLPLIVASMRNIYWTNYELWVTASMLTVAPVMLLYAVAQRQFMRGIAMTGLKT